MTKVSKDAVEALSLSIWPLVLNDDGKPPKINMEVAIGIVQRLGAHGYHLRRETMTEAELEADIWQIAADYGISVMAADRIVELAKKFRG